MKWLIKCGQCGELHWCHNWKIEKYKSEGKKNFCSLKCFGESKKKTPLPVEEKKRLKAEYDREYREKNRERRKSQKAEYFKKTYDPESAAIKRKERMPYHVEYCRRPEYRSKKQIYDQEHRAKKIHGEYWESAILIEKIEKEYDTHQANIQNNTYNKSIKRRRAWLRRQKTDLVRST